MKKGISQEGLKLIACLTMLIDHIGYAVIYPIYSSISAAGSAAMPEVKLVYYFYLLCRCIGRIAFPIFVFLLVEGIHRTRNRKKYALRLLVGALISEIPFNLILSGQLSWRQQSVMVTLLLGFCAVIAMERCRSLAWKPVAAVPFLILGKLLKVDYGWAGVAMAVLFALSREMYAKNLVLAGGMVVLSHHIASHIFWIGNISVPMQVLGLLSLLFIARYDGRKVTGNRAVQWGFYLFYPLHLLILWAIGRLIPDVLMVGISVAM